MTAATGGERRRINADGIHDLVTGRKAAAFYRHLSREWVIRVGDDTTLVNVLRQLGVLGYRLDRDFTVGELTVYLHAEDITS